MLKKAPVQNGDFNKKEHHALSHGHCAQGMDTLSRLIIIIQEGNLINVALYCWKCSRFGLCNIPLLRDGLHEIKLLKTVSILFVCLSAFRLSVCLYVSLYLVLWKNLEGQCIGPYKTMMIRIELELNCSY